MKVKLLSNTHCCVTLSSLLAMDAHPLDVKTNLQSQDATKGEPWLTATSTRSNSSGLRSLCARRMWLEFVVSGKMPMTSKKRSHASRENKRRKRYQRRTSGMTVATHARLRLRSKCGQAGWHSRTPCATHSKRKCLKSNPMMQPLRIERFQQRD